MWNLILTDDIKIKKMSFLFSDNSCRKEQKCIIVHLIIPKAKTYGHKIKKSIGIFEEGEIYKIHISNIEEVDENLWNTLL